MSMEQYFFEAFEGMKRLGPGSKESTLKAAALYPVRNAPVKILDVGCGVGAHTFQLAQLLPMAEITAIDNNPAHIAEFQKTAELSGLSMRVKGAVMSMFEMTFADESFDLIWAEGSIYIAGFTNGIRDWKRLLKTDGYLICSEISWLVDHPSEKCRQYWSEAYAEMDSVANKLEQIKSAGYIPQESFVCPPSDWTENYYDLLQANLHRIEKKYSKHTEAMGVVKMLQEEIDLYRQHGNEYSYVFYVMKKIG